MATTERHDIMPLPIVQFHLVPSSPARGDWLVQVSTFGQVPSKMHTVFGYKLHLLIAMDGVILDFELAPVDEFDLQAGFERLPEQTDLHVLGDKAYIFSIRPEQGYNMPEVRSYASYPRGSNQAHCSGVRTPGSSG